VHVRIDSIEQAIRESGLVAGFLDDAGYRVGYAIAADNLGLGHTVIADSVNPVSATRDAWIDVANRAGVGALEIEITCSDPQEHQRRVETRTTDIPGLRLPSWQDVAQRHYVPWERERIVIDTASGSLEDHLNTLRAALGSASRASIRR
jgi:predicted kinase